MRVLNIGEEEKDGYVNIDIEVNDEEEKILLEKGLNCILKEYINNIQHKNSESYANIIQPNNTIYVGLYSDENENDYHLYVYNINYKYLTWYEGKDLCSKISDRYLFYFPTLKELTLITGKLGEYLIKENYSLIWFEEPNDEFYDSYKNICRVNKKIYHHELSYIENHNYNIARVLPVCRLYIN